MAPALHDWDRRWAALRQRHGAVRNRLPEFAVRWLRTGRDGFKAVRTALARVEHASPHTNLYHCCVHKTGSQWIAALLDDLVTYRYCGLRRHVYQDSLPGGVDPRPLTERSFPGGFPEHCIVGPLYVDYANFRAAPKPESWRAFFVQRDPRDLVVSWYFSARYSHRAVGNLPRIRAELEARPKEEGLRFTIDHLQRAGMFAALRSWAENGAEDEAVSIVRYEDLIAGDGFPAFRRLFDHLDVPVPDEALRAMLAAYGFRGLTGRKPGESDDHSHLRTGRPEDWRNHLTPSLLDRLGEITDGLPQALGYDAAAH